MSVTQWNTPPEIINSQQSSLILTKKSSFEAKVKIYSTKSWFHLKKWALLQQSVHKI